MIYVYVNVYIHIYLCVILRICVPVLCVCNALSMCIYIYIGAYVYDFRMVKDEGVFRYLNEIDIWHWRTCTSNKYTSVRCVYMATYTWRGQSRRSIRREIFMETCIISNIQVHLHHDHHHHHLLLSVWIATPKQ